MRMRDGFLVHYLGRSCRCLALQIEWGRYTSWLTPIKSIYVRGMRMMSFRALVYLENVLIEPSAFGNTETKKYVLNDAR